MSNSITSSPVNGNRVLTPEEQQQIAALLWQQRKQEDELLPTLTRKQRAQLGKMKFARLNLWAVLDLGDEAVVQYG